MAVVPDQGVQIPILRTGFVDDVLAPPPPEAQPVDQQVVVAVDAYAEIDPAQARTLGMVVLPHVALIDGKTRALDADCTLHAHCWAEPPRRVTLMPSELGNVAQFYEPILATGRHVLALHLPARLDGNVRTSM